MKNYKKSLFNNNGVWCFKYTIIDNITGTSKRKSKTTGVKYVAEDVSVRLNRQSRREAEKIMYEFLDGLEGSDLNAEMYLHEWLNEFMAYQKSHLAITSWQREKNRYTKHILPYFTQHKYTLRELQPIHLNKFFDWCKTERNLAPASVKLIKSIINSGLEYAVVNQIIPTNVCKFTVQIKKSKPKYDWFEVEELQQLLDAVQGHELETPVILTILLGLRREEVLGLRWSNIDLNKRKLEIAGTLVYVCGAPEKYQYRDNTAKNDNSLGSYYINDALYDYLVALKQKQKSMERRTNKWTDYLCVRADGNIITPDHITKTFPKLTEDIGLRRMKFHNLRHSAVTMLAQTHSIKECQVFARHKNYQTTLNIYTHVRDSRKAEMLDTVTTQLNFR